MEYTVAIRTLGKAGDKYQKTLDSLMAQSIPPSAIHIYIAEGYELPKETVNFEKYIYVKKGMVAQRALLYDDIKTEYILFLDDDVTFPKEFVANLYQHLMREKADVISPDIYDNSHRWSCMGKMLMSLSARMYARKDDGIWAFKVMKSTGFSFNAHPTKEVYLSQTNAGACFFCKKETFLDIHFEDELWLDRVSYPMGEDEVMFYKMFLSGKKILTYFNSGIVHLDGSNSIESKEKEKLRIYSDFRFKTIFWHRFIFLPESSLFCRVWASLCIGYVVLFSMLTSILKGNGRILKVKYSAIRDGLGFIKSYEYQVLPKLKKYGEFI